VNRQLVGLEGNAGVAPDQDPEAVHPVGLLHDVDHVADVHRSLLGGTGHEEAHDGGLAVTGHQQRIVGDVEVILEGHHVGSQRGDLGGQRLDLRAEGGVVHGHGR